LNALDHSLLIVNLLQGVGLDVTFIVNGIEYVQNDLLIDGIYPHWSIFVQTIHQTPRGKKYHALLLHMNLVGRLRNMFLG